MADSAQTAQAAASKTAKTAADQAAAFGKQAFKDTVETSMNSFAELGAVSKRNIEAMTDSFNAASQGAQALGAQAVAYSKKAFEDQVATAKSLAAAKTVQEAMDIQAGYAKQAMEGYMAEMNRWTDTFSATAKSSFKPINERVTAVVEQLQTAR
jgi:phasin family protein